MSYISRKMAQSVMVVGLIGAPVMALAADFSPPVGRAVPYAAAPLPYRWDGFYVGINGGGSFGWSYWDLAANTFSTSGWMFGVTGGYNMQFARLVVGLEADFDYVDESGSATLGGCVTRCRISNDYLGTVRGRVGYALDRFFPYFTAGVAVGKIEVARGGVGSQSEWRIGYTVGAGLETAAFANWTVKGEYLFVDLGKDSCSPVCGAAPANTANYQTNVWRLGLNYRF